MKNTPWKNSKEYYDFQSAEIYSNPTTKFYHRALMGNSDEEFLKYIIKEANINDKSDVLDLGCGSGYLVDELNKFCKAEGVTNSITNFNYCKETYPNSKYILSDMESVKTKKKTHCLTLESFNYANCESTLKNISTILKKGGILFMKEWCGLEDESELAKENRLYFEEFFYYKAIKCSKIVNTAQKYNLKLIDKINLDGKYNKSLYKSTINYHHESKSQFVMPNDGAKYLYPVQLKFQKI